MKTILKTALAVSAIALCAPATAFANHHAGTEAPMPAADAALVAVINADIRKDDMARDKYRHPAETLTFFQVKPDQTVVEYSPGGGWYTRILAPYVQEKGRYIGVNTDTSSVTFSDPEREQRAKAWPQQFPATAAKEAGVDAAKIMAFESDEVPDDVKGTVDRILIFRSLHGMMNGNRADSEVKNLRAMLADDGMIGVVQHRANEDAGYEWTNGSKGYLRQSDVVALFTMHGFDLVDSSEVNANPKDTKDYPDGVWTLPPVLGADKENEAKYLAIGESDRMTLLFRKRP
ncbi:class I SAM-dependent methyltransferase [Sphingorhabdus arenilitoris]|uniref:Class I SAM-dependent methyltransferase n=1 Tax=Sphingorhabdus arenilitoris TaxID=1490041 RepID=A0ABV8RH50_9SPHN